MLIRCKECGAQVSDLAKACPHCGAPVKMRVGLLDGVLQWIGEKREAFIEAKRVRQERLRREKEKEARRREEELRLEYVRNFNYSTKPYTNPMYASLDCGAIRKGLCAATSYQEILDALSPFPNVQEGYYANLPWLKEWDSLNHDGRVVDVLYVAYCMDDRETCDSLIENGCVLREELGCRVLRKLAKGTVDEKTRGFIDRYVGFTQAALDYYRQHIEWLPLIDANDKEKISFYVALGVRPEIGDEGLWAYKRGHLLAAGGVNYAQIWKTSPLAKALDADDLNRIRLLLKWGANTEQWMFVSYRCDSAAGENSHVSYCDPLLCKIKSVEAFRLMSTAGMNWYPDGGTSLRPDLIEHLWKGEPINGKRLELLNYLYSIGYDKRLLEKRTAIEDSIRNHEGRPYTKNIEFVKAWLASH